METVKTLQELIDGFSLEEWEWYTIGDNNLGYHNWLISISRILGLSKEEVNRRYHKRVMDGWRKRVESTQMAKAKA